MTKAAVMVVVMTEAVPNDTRERNAWLKYKMQLAGFSFADLARELQLHRGTPQEVLRRSYPRMEEIIAAKLGLSPQDIWPERYEEKRLRHDVSIGRAAKQRNRHRRRKRKDA